MLFGILPPVTGGQDRSNERRALLNRLSEFSRGAFPSVEVVIYEANSSFNAMAFSVGQQQIVTLFAGLAFNRHMGKDGLLFAILHEIGHHLAGGPRITRTSPLSCDCAADLWVIVEGQKAIASQGMALDVSVALSEIEAAMSDLGSASHLVSGRYCFDWARRKFTLSSRSSAPLVQCEYRAALDNPTGAENGVFNSEWQRHECHK